MGNNTVSNFVKMFAAITGIILLAVIFGTACTHTQPHLVPTETVLAPAATDTPSPAPTSTFTPTIPTTPSLTPTPTLPPEFLSQFAGTAYSVKDNQVLYTPENGQAKQIASVEGGKLVFSVKGQEVSVDQKLATVPEAKWFLNGAADQIVAVNDPTETYWQYEFNRQTGEWVEMALPEPSTNINALTKIVWNDIVSNRWATAVRQAIDAGKIKTFGPNVIISDMELEFSSTDLHGWNGPTFTTGNSKYVTDPSTRPIMPAAYAQILMDNGQYRKLAIVQVAQKGGSYGLISVGDLQSIAGDTWESDVTDNTQFSLPVTDATDELCKYYDNSICRWQVSSGNELISEAVNKWITQGILDPILGRVLFIMQGGHWF